MFVSVFNLELFTLGYIVREKEGIRTPFTVNENEIITKRAEVGRVGFEPTTPAMSRRYLNQARPPAPLN